MAKKPKVSPRERLQPHTHNGRCCSECGSELDDRHLCPQCGGDPPPVMTEQRPPVSVAVEGRILERDPPPTLLDYASELQDRNEEGDEFDELPLLHSLPDNGVTRALLAEIVLEELEALLKIRRARIASLLPPNFGLDGSEDDTTVRQEITTRGLLEQILLGLARDTSKAIARIKANDGWGRCQQCGEYIDIHRLLACKEASLCIRCATATNK